MAMKVQRLAPTKATPFHSPQYRTVEEAAKVEKAAAAEEAVEFDLQPKEAAIQAAIIARLVAHGWLVVRVNSGGFKDRKGTFVRGYTIAGLNAISGFPDLVAFKGARFLLIECKKHDGQETESQKRFAEYAGTRGVEVHLMRDPREVDGVLGEL